ncbi:lipase 1 [Xylogone sp. PMI_703]|nr:lipase 1 [Xylogone sp. PMI_703]
MIPVILLACLLSSSFATPVAHNRRSSPTVNIRYGTIVGSNINGIDSFKGIPFAQPPTGPLRLKPPHAITSNTGVVQATGTPNACPQFNAQYNLSALPDTVLTLLADLLNTVENQSEDCLTIDVYRPSTAKPGSNLPVVFWIYGGAFESGSTQGQNPTNLIQASIDAGKPMIYVQANYRLGGFGFLGGKEILADGSSNLGLLDQRLALQWTADNIEQFGGDPSKVTIWGFSAGAMSVFDQMALYGGNNTYKDKPLFRAALMESGSILPADSVDSPKAQAIYDMVVDSAGCRGSKDSLSCLRSVDYATFLNAASSVPVASSYNSIALSYLPRPDGAVLPASPDVLANRGQVAKVPVLIGNQEDEGTDFSIYQGNITNNQQLVEYLKTLYFQNATTTQVEAFVATYPDDAAAGSPFRTGDANNIYPEYKRLAAILGDYAFILQRRLFLNTFEKNALSVPTWSYLASYFYGLPVLGTFHGLSSLYAYGVLPGYPSSIIQQSYISFINDIDPNDGNLLLPAWPQWKEGQQLLNLQALTTVIVPDIFRQESYSFLTSNIDVLRM